MAELLITFSVLIVIVAVLRFALKNKLSRRIRYALWGLVVLRLLLPFPLFTSPISAADVRTTSAVQSMAQNTQITVLPYEPYTLEEYAAEYSIPLEQAQYEVDGTDLEAAGKERQSIPLETLLKRIWIGGAVLAAVWFAVKNSVFAAKLRKVRVPVENDCRLKVYRADFLHSPCLFGLLKPAVYLNEKALADENTIKTVLTHELCHYAHGDHLWSFVRCVLLAVYWFDPFVWMAAAMSRTDCELACDEAAVKKLGEENRIAYGKALVGMIEIKQAPVGLACAATTMVSGKRGIKERVKMIANNHKTRAWAAVALALIMVLAIGCTFGTAKQKEPVTASEMTVAGLQLGMTTDEITRLLGEPLTAQEMKMREDSPHTYLIWEYEGLSLRFTFSGVEGGHLLSSATISDGSYRLPSGLEVGVNYEKVLKTYAKGVDYGEPNSDYSADLLMFGTDEDSGSLFRLITSDPADITMIYRNLADSDQTGSGTAYFSKTYAGGMINYCWYPSGSDAFLVLSFIFDETGKVTEISFGDAEKNPVSWQSGSIVTPDDMALGELKLGLTMDEVRAIMGEPTKIFDSDNLEENLFIYGHYYTWYYGDELQLKFYQFDGILTAPYRLGSVWSQSKSHQLPSGLTVGEKFIRVIEAYARDDHFGEKISDNNGEPVGYYLYGGQMVGNLNELPLTEAVGTAYVDNDNGTGNGMIVYNWYPVGSNGFENSYSLIFDLDSFKNVTRIRFDYYSMMDSPQEPETSPASQSIAEYPDWSTWTRPVTRHELIGYEELLAKMPKIMPNADASRFTAKDGTIGGIGAGATLEDIKKKFGEPIGIYKETDSEILDYFYQYNGAYFIFFKGFINNDNTSYSPNENGEYVSMAVVYGEGVEGPRGIKIGDSFESVMAIYPQDKDYLKNELFYGKNSFNGPSGKVYVKDITGYNDPFGEAEGPGCPVEVILVPDGTYPFAKLFFDDNLILREMRIYYKPSYA